MPAKTLMIQGTGSDVGKSIITAAFCRWFKNRGVRVAPFKAQNMSLNSFVTSDGLEMGRAQVFQAQACGIEPHVSMNPILLKPSGDNNSQVILMGKPVDTNNAKEYYAKRTRHAETVKEAFDFLQNQYEMIIIEGAGSPAEINLRHLDVVNMAMARMADAPVLLVGDIDRGGVFAWMKGTYDLLTSDEQDRVAGFIINKFRGDIDLLTPGVEQFQDMIGKPVLGVIPFQRDLFVDEEDGLPNLYSPATGKESGSLTVAILRLPRISNFTDFSPLLQDPNVTVQYVWHPAQMANPDLIIIPGSKNSLADCQFLRDHGLDQAIIQEHKSGSFLLGVCAGFQMLGETISDPSRVESSLEKIKGLGLFRMQTTIKPEKITRQISTRTRTCALFPEGLTLSGYEIHMGTTDFKEAYEPVFSNLNGTPSDELGICNEPGTLMGTYLHGLFDSDHFRNVFLNHIRRVRGHSIPETNFEISHLREEQFERLGKLIEDHLDMKQLSTILGCAS